MAEVVTKTPHDESAAAVKEKHLRLAGVIKGVHANLRKKFHQSGNIDIVWKEHCEDGAMLSDYADAMHHLATEIWTKHPETRIDWCRKICLEYFYQGGLQKVLEKEERKKTYARNSPRLRIEDAASGDSNSTSSGHGQGLSNNETINLPSINVLSASANQITDDLFPLPTNGKDDFVLDIPCRNQNSLSPGTSLLDEASSPDIESVSQYGEDCFMIPAESSDTSPSSPTRTLSLMRASSPKGSTCSGSAPQNSETDSELIFGYPDGVEPEITRVVSPPNSHQYNTIDLPFEGKIQLLDVGSCFNPFQKFDEFLALGIDISPAVETVYHCDFLHLEITDPLQLASDSVATYIRNLKNPVESLPSESFHVIVFSLLLEYFPSTYQRWLCCQRAQKLLAVNGLLVIITPDSHNQNRNAPMIKSWKIAIESLGFSRWRYVKLEHLHCMVFRKIREEQPEQPCVLVTDVGPDMLYIPQDFHDHQEEENSSAYLFGSVPWAEEDRNSFMSSMEEMPSLVDSI